MDRRLLIGAGAFIAVFAAGLPGLCDPLATVEPDDMTMGAPRAPVTVIEYASASCPHCARFNNEVFPAFKAKYIDTGKVYYALREFLTEPVQVAAAAFLVARCAGKRQYFKVVDAFFHAQEQIYQTGDLKGPLLKIAASVGLDEKAVDACLADAQAAKALNDRVDRYASRDDIRATPTFLVNGKRLEGEQSLADLSTAVDAALAVARRR